MAAMSIKRGTQTICDDQIIISTKSEMKDIVNKEMLQKLIKKKLTKPYKEGRFMASQAKRQ